MIRCYSPRKKRKTVKRFLAWLQSQILIRHPLTVHVTNTQVITEVDGYHLGACFGVAMLPKDRRDPGPIKIVVAGVHSITNILSVLAHEIAHYVQWRSKKKIDEHDANRRARLWIKAWRER